MEPLTTIAILRGLTEFVPHLARWIGGDKAGAVADQAIDIARQVTGQAEPPDALEAIRRDPQLQIQLQQAMTPVIIAQLEADARELESINATMRAEYASSDEYVRRWRPYWGYITARAWMLQIAMLAVVVIGAVIATVMGQTAAVDALLAGAATLVGALTVQWGIALTVLGVSVSKRTHDKCIAAGQPPPTGVIDLIAQRLIPKTPTPREPHGH